MPPKAVPPSLRKVKALRSNTPAKDEILAVANAPQVTHVNTNNAVDLAGQLDIAIQRRQAAEQAINTFTATYAGPKTRKFSDALEPYQESLEKWGTEVLNIEIAINTLEDSLKTCESRDMRQEELEIHISEELLSSRTNAIDIDASSPNEQQAISAPMGADNIQGEGHHGQAMLSAGSFLNQQMVIDATIGTTTQEKLSTTPIAIRPFF
ncbi:hypothetical protein HYPSUDRAFT_59380 [Hypholoma sublateritium FD-334 SS-4]|uniref:Uncharacterized protein n=1 Tax=Hypholoma sublateritium (strain FD-334 SS-4) TaxID=945553 RepID=A0A0D2P1C6_HYPSF|nr:hypothetical protein HYPSUDRAFT_59380 [Hypholoma sublateritium FD-334 SS-4]